MCINHLNGRIKENISHDISLFWLLFMTNVFTTISNSSYFMDEFKHAHFKDYVNVAGHVVIKL